MLLICWFLNKGKGEKGEKSERQIPNKGDCLGDPSVSCVGSTMRGKMARRIAARAGLAGLPGRRRKQESGRGKVENKDGTRLEGSCLITASQQPV